MIAPMPKRRNNTEDNFEDTSQPLEGTSESHESGYRDDYFLGDPASWWDNLPQPFVMIDKIVNYLLERVWSSIEQRQRVKRSQRISRTDSAACNTPTVYGPGGVLSQVSNISNAGYCDDEPYIVFGTASGLYVVDGLSQTVCASWQGPNTEILETHLYSTPQKTFLITSVDDLGDARVFLFIEPDILQLVFTVYEKVENEVKPLVATCAASASGEYLAVSIDSTSNRKARSIAVYSLPFENWDTQLRANTPTKQEARQTSPVETVVEDTQPAALLTDGKEEKNSQFQKPILILKIPALEISPGNPSKNLQQICKSVDVSGEVIGTGYNNIISQTHLDLRKAVLEYLHEDLKRYTQDPETPLRPLNFHFIQSTALSFPCDGQNQVNSSAILVWCSDSHILSLYLLGKLRKEGAFLEPDKVWPFAAVITALAVSRFSTMLAIGLENGCVVVWDIYFGIMRGVHYLGGPSSVRQLHFIYSERYQDPTQKGDFACDIIATLRNGATQRITSSASEPLTAITILPEAHSDDILVMRLIPIPGRNELVLITFSNGVVVLVDVFEGDSLCELQLSAGYHLSCSWAPVISVVSNSKSLTNDLKSYAYIIGNSEATSGCCFYFQLNKLPVLKPYWSSLSKTQISITSISLEKKQNVFLNERRHQQKERNARLSVRWKELSQYISPAMNDVEKLEVAG